MKDALKNHKQNQNKDRKKSFYGHMGNSQNLRNGQINSLTQLRLTVDNYLRHQQYIVITEVEPPTDVHKDTKVMIEDHTQIIEAIADHIVEDTTTITTTTVREDTTEVPKYITVITEVEIAGSIGQTKTTKKRTLDTIQKTIPETIPDVIRKKPRINPRNRSPYENSNDNRNRNYNR